MDKLYPLVQLLADGKFHSGEALAEQFGVTRAAIWKQLKRLAQLPGIRVDSVRGRGYRLAVALELLDQQRLLASVGEVEQARLQQLHILPSIHSTNTFLAERGRPKNGHGAVCIAEHQTTGRGRRGRNWASTFGQNVYLSLDWVFDLPLRELSGISLVAGVTLARVLSENGVADHCLKWPNDVHIAQRKLAGVLVEAFGEAEGPARAVIGIGINLRMDKEDADSIDQPWIDLAAVMKQPPSRNKLAGDLLNGLLQACMTYQRVGLAPFLAAWSEYDHYRGQAVQLLMGDQVIKGQYQGLDSSGGLILESSRGRRVYHAGEISMRAGEHS